MKYIKFLLGNERIWAKVIKSYKTKSGIEKLEVKLANKPLNKKYKFGQIFKIRKSRVIEQTNKI